MGWRKSTRSIEAVTTDARQWRNAAIAAHLSIIDSTTPPKTCPRLLASWGIISSEVSCWLSWTALLRRNWVVGSGGVGRRESRDEDYFPRFDGDGGKHTAYHDWDDFQ